MPVEFKRLKEPKKGWRARLPFTPEPQHEPSVYADSFEAEFPRSDQYAAHDFYQPETQPVSEPDPESSPQQ